MPQMRVTKQSAVVALSWRLTQPCWAVYTSWNQPPAHCNHSADCLVPAGLRAEAHRAHTPELRKERSLIRACRLTVLWQTCKPARCRLNHPNNAAARIQDLASPAVPLAGGVVLAPPSGTTTWACLGAALLLPLLGFARADLGGAAVLALLLR